MPDASGKFKGISVPSIPWSEKGHGMNEIKSHPEQSDTADLLEEIANLLRQGAIYLGHRRDGKNDLFEYVSIQLKVPR